MNRTTTQIGSLLKGLAIIGLVLTFALLAFNSAKDAAEAHKARLEQVMEVK